MAETLSDLLAETSAVLGEMIGDPNVPVGYSPHLMAAKTRIRKAADAIERMQGALEAIQHMSEEEIKARFGNHPSKSPEQLGRNSAIYHLLVLPGNIARAALSFPIRAPTLDEDDGQHINRDGDQ